VVSRCLQDPGISWSFSPGMMGATETPVGIPAAESSRIARSRKAGVLALGSSWRAKTGSRLVTERSTAVALNCAKFARTSMSRVTKWFLVIMVTGLRKSRRTSQAGPGDLVISSRWADNGP